MSRVARSIPTQSPQEVVRLIPGLIDRHRAACRITAGDQVGMDRPITVQVIDRRGQPWASRWRVRVYIADAEGGDPITGETVTFTTGEVLEEILPGGYWEVLSSTAGLVVFDHTVAGPASRWIYAEAVGEPEGSEEIEWA